MRMRSVVFADALQVRRVCMKQRARSKPDLAGKQARLPDAGVAGGMLVRTIPVGHEAYGAS